MDITYDNTGERFFMDRYGIIGESIDLPNNYSRQDSIRTMLYSKAVEADSLVSDMHYSYPYMFSEKDILPLLTND